MALRKHDSVVVLEIISAFALIGTLSIALMLFLIHQDLSSMKTNTSTENKTPVAEEVVVETENKKVTAEDLDGSLIEDINKSFSTLNQSDVSQQQSQAQMGYYLQKVLEKQFSQDELQALDAELKKEIEAAQKAQEEAKAKQATPAAAPAQ